MSVITILQAAGLNPFRDSDHGVSTRSDRSTAQILSLKPGAEVQGTVGKQLPGGGTIVTILGRDMELNLPKPLPPGTTLNFTVLRTEPQIELKLPLQEAVNADQKNTSLNQSPLANTSGDPTERGPSATRSDHRGAAAEQDRTTRLPGLEQRNLPKPPTAVINDTAFLGRERADAAPGRRVFANPYEAQSQHGAEQGARSAAPTHAQPEKPMTLSVGDVFSARVLKTDESGKTEIALNNRHLSVQVEAPLKEGDVAIFKVARTEPEVELRPLKAAGGASISGAGGETREAALGENIGELKTAVESLLREESDSPRLKGKLELLSKVLDEIVFDDKKLDKNDFLRVFFRRTGQTLERSIFRELAETPPEPGKPSSEAENLKSMALDFLRHWEEPGEDHVKHKIEDKVLAQVVKLADSIEGEQVRNTHTLPAEGTLRFQIPFAFHEHISTGWLSLHFDLSKEQSDADRPASREIMMVFFLDLTMLGGVRVDAGLKDNKRVRMEILVEHEPVADFVRQALPELTKRLDAHGLEVESARVSTAAREKIETRDDHPSPGVGFFQANIHVVA